MTLSRWHHVTIVIIIETINQTSITHLIDRLIKFNRYGHQLNAKELDFMISQFHSENIKFSWCKLRLKLHQICPDFSHIMKSPSTFARACATQQWKLHESSTYSSWVMRVWTICVLEKVAHQNSRYDDKKNFGYLSYSE